MKLKRDIVISITNGWEELVGVYPIGTKGHKILFVAPPKVADAIIKVWNKNHKQIKLIAKLQ